LDFQQLQVTLSRLFPVSYVVRKLQAECVSRDTPESPFQDSLSQSFEHGFETKGRLSLPSLAEPVPHVLIHFAGPEATAVFNRTLANDDTTFHLLMSPYVFVPSHDSTLGAAAVLLANTRTLKPPSSLVTKPISMPCVLALGMQPSTWKDGIRPNRGDVFQHIDAPTDSILPVKLYKGSENMKYEV
jgi:hypothetical protein